MSLGKGLAIALLGAFALPYAAAAKRPLSVADMIATPEFLRDPGVDRANPPVVSISPDGKRFAVRLVRGDLKANGLWLEIHSGLTAQPQRIHRVARLFASGYGSPDNPFHPAANSYAGPVWMSEHRLALLWEDEKDVIQVMAVDVEDGSTVSLTASATDVTDFSADARGNLIYVTQISHSSHAAETIARGFMVEADDAMGLLAGDPSAPSVLERYYDGRFWLARPGRAPLRLAIEKAWSMAFQPRFGRRFALVDARPSIIPETWRRYDRKDFVGGLDLVGTALKEPRAWYGRQLTQLQLVDLETGDVSPLWDAPTPNPYILKAAWSPDGTRLVVSPVLLPGDAGLHTVEVDTVRGDVRKIPVGGPVKTVRWEAVDRVIIDGTRFVLEADAWHASGPATSPSLPSTQLVMREELNSPPRLYAGAQLIFDPSAGFSDRFALGRVEQVSFPDGEGRTWSALLYHPVGERKNHRYPLVIQTHGRAGATSFSLRGMSDPLVSIYAAQALAGLDIAVLQIENKSMPGVSVTPREPAAYAAAYEAGIDHLVKIGLIDPARVGIAGFSRTGWHVAWALTHRDFPYAAAIVSDNIFAGYWEGTIGPGTMELENGGPLAGAGLESWLETAPAFAAERLRTPLRMQKESGGMAGVVSKWEFFARARRAGAPIEYRVIPHIDKGTHNLRNPGQLYDSAQGAVEWWNFWLNGTDPADPGTRARWHDLRGRRDALKSVTRPPLLDWTAAPSEVRRSQ